MSEPSGAKARTAVLLLIAFAVLAMFLMLVRGCIIVVEDSLDSLTYDMYPGMKPTE